ncbi:MAG: hypothetical protein IIC60_04300 [Proteobacteria bacterium]|nr:hypothetical protein [Pseudomonadota bacterium]
MCSTAPELPDQWMQRLTAYSRINETKPSANISVSDRSLVGSFMQALTEQEMEKLKAIKGTGGIKFLSVTSLAKKHSLFFTL